MSAWHPYEPWNASVEAHCMQDRRVSNQRGVTVIGTNCRCHRNVFLIKNPPRRYIVLGINYLSRYEIISVHEYLSPSVTNSQWCIKSTVITITAGNILVVTLDVSRTVLEILTRKTRK